MENELNFKKYIYISTKVRTEIEEIMSENKIIQTIRFIGTYDIETFFRDQLKNLKGITFLVLDLASFESSKDNDILTIIKLIRQAYDCRIIIIAEGYKQGDYILGKMFNLGIYNIINSKNDVEFIEQFKKTITDEGMTFGNSVRFRIDDKLNIETGKTVVKEIYTKVKQIVTVGVVSTEKHSGATTLAINLAKFLNEFDNVTACYIENNDHNSIKSLDKLEDSVYYEQKGMINYNGLDLYLKPENMSQIQKYDYSFYIYDFGNFDEMSDEVKNNFISRDLKFVVSGSRVWEENKIADCLFSLGSDQTSYLFVNFLKTEEREEFKKIVGSDWCEKTYFSDLIFDPFEIKNRDLYRKILEPYLLNQNIKEDKKNNIFSSLISKLGKGKNK